MLRRVEVEPPGEFQGVAANPHFRSQIHVNGGIRVRVDARALNGSGNGCRQIEVGGRRLWGLACVVEELAHDRIHLFDVANHRCACVGVQWRQLQLEPQAR